MSTSVAVTDKQWVDTTSIYRNDPLRGLALALHYSAVEGRHGFKELLEKEFRADSELASKHFNNLYLEYLVLFMHLMNRHGAELLGRKYTVLQKELLPYIASNVGTHFNGDLKQLSALVAHTANDAETDYAECKYWISPTEKDSFKAYADKHATVVQFHKRLARALDKDENDFMAKMEINTYSFHGQSLFFSLIDLEEWLKGPAIYLGIKQFDSINLKPPGAKQ